MTHPGIGFLEPVPWSPGLVGEFPGQEATLPLGTTGESLTLCWCPPPPAGHPLHPAAGFWLAKHLVNRRQWRAVMGTDPSQLPGSDLHPVDSVSWKDAVAFCQETDLRLPADGEWEYACRAGTETPFAIGTGNDLNAQLANFNGHFPDGEGPGAFKWWYRGGTTPQACFPPNGWGLHDMHGQLWEWCMEMHVDGRSRVLRGGCWQHGSFSARSRYPDYNDPLSRFHGFGFRPCPSFNIKVDLARSEALAPRGAGLRAQ